MVCLTAFLTPAWAEATSQLLVRVRAGGTAVAWLMPALVTAQTLVPGLVCRVLAYTSASTATDANTDAGTCTRTGICENS